MSLVTYGNRSLNSVPTGSGSRYRFWRRTSSLKDDFFDSLINRNSKLIAHGFMQHSMPLSLLTILAQISTQCLFVAVFNLQCDYEVIFGFSMTHNTSIHVSSFLYSICSFIMHKQVRILHYQYSKQPLYCVFSMLYNTLHNFRNTTLFMVSESCG